MTVAERIAELVAAAEDYMGIAGGYVPDEVAIDPESDFGESEDRLIDAIDFFKEDHS